MEEAGRLDSEARELRSLLHPCSIPFVLAGLFLRGGDVTFILITIAFIMIRLTLKELNVGDCC